MFRPALFLGAVGLFAGVLMSGQAGAADLVFKAPPPAAATPCAVDGLNGKIAAFGGTFADQALFGGQGSFSAPIGCQFGLQVDALASSYDDHFLGAVAAHFFARDPSRGLIGIYGSTSRWDKFDGVRANHIAPEFELYFGRFTLQGIAGLEFGNTASGVVGGNLVTYDVKDRWFDQINLAYYPIDNLKAFVGHRYLGGRHALALGAEYGIPMSQGAMAAVFAEGRAGESDFFGAWGGVRIYFGQKDKTLIRRHREDDPPDWNPNVGSVANPNSTTPIIVGCGRSCS